MPFEKATGPAEVVGILIRTNVYVHCRIIVQFPILERGQLSYNGMYLVPVSKLAVMGSNSGWC